MLIALLFFGLATALGGLAASWIAVRGAPVDNHPICRKCGFDLSGRPSASIACPECGADLCRPRAFRTGNRQRKTGMLIIGILGLVLGSGGSAGLGVALQSAVDFNSYEPVWFLRYQAENARAVRRDGALMELLRRAESGQLSNLQTHGLTAAALSIQRDPKRQWTPLWGDLIEAFHNTNSLSPDDWAAYAHNAVRLSLAVRPRVRRGDPIPLVLRQSVPRVGTGSAFFVTFADIYFEARGQRVDVNTWERLTWAPLEPNGRDVQGWKLSLTDLDWAQLRDGPQTVTLNCLFKVYPDSTGFEPPPDFPGTLKRPLLVEPIAVTGAYTLLPSEQPSNEMVDRAELRGAMEAALRPKDIRYDPQPYEPRFYVVEVEQHTVPFPVALRVYFRTGGGEWVSGRYNNVVCMASDRATFYGGILALMDDSFRERHPDFVDVILRPDPSLTADEYDIHPIWGREITYEHIAVRWPDSKTQSIKPDRSPSRASSTGPN